MKKLYTIRKYIFADDLKHALKQEPTHPVDDAWIDGDWIKSHVDDFEDSIAKIDGFKLKRKK